MSGTDVVKIEVRPVMEAQVACSVDGFDPALRERKRVSFGGRSTWRLHSNVPKYEVAGPGRAAVKASCCRVSSCSRADTRA